MPTAALAAGQVIATGVQIYGQVKANQAQAKAEQANAAFYQEQAEFSRQATRREVSIYQDQANEFFGKQVSQIAAGGVNLTGSALLVLGETHMKAMQEVDAIVEDGRMKTHEALLRAGASSEAANRLSSFSNNALPAIGTIITNATNAAVSFRRGG